MATAGLLALGVWSSAAVAQTPPGDGTVETTAPPEQTAAPETTAPSEPTTTRRQREEDIPGTDETVPPTTAPPETAPPVTETTPAPPVAEAVPPAAPTPPAAANPGHADPGRRRAGRRSPPPRPRTRPTCRSPDRVGWRSSPGCRSSLRPPGCSCAGPAGGPTRS